MLSFDKVKSLNINIKQHRIKDVVFLDILARKRVEQIHFYYHEINYTDLIKMTIFLRSKKMNLRTHGKNNKVGQNRTVVLNLRAEKQSELHAYFSLSIQKAAAFFPTQHLGKIIHCKSAQQANFFVFPFPLKVSPWPGI
jgi:hypothetical protein